MSSEVKLIEKSVKYTINTTGIFVMSAFVLGKAYQYLALASFNLPLSSTWDSIEAISGLSVDRSLRYFSFYLFSYIFFACYERSTLKLSHWGVLLLLGIYPALMSFFPFAFSGAFGSSPSWALTAILLSLLYLEVGPRHEAKELRRFFELVIAGIVLFQVMNDVNVWGEAINQQAVKLFGEGDLSLRRTNQSFVWFAPAELFAVGVQLYLIYWLPKKFFLETRANDRSGD